jgi:putative N6-adenine-specific DNA methylase
MNTDTDFEIFLVAPPGLEDILCAEVLEKGFPDPKTIPGGVMFQGNWHDVWRANLELRGAGRVLARIGAFRAMHLAQLDKRARKFPWSDHLRPDVALRVEVTCKASRIYHAGAAAQRIETALVEAFGAIIADDAPVTLKVRIEDDLCIFSVDTSGEALHKRGHKEAVGKAPMRENLAALFLRKCGYDGTEPVVDPMCGSGTFVIEAAEIALGVLPGRSRAFAFEYLRSFDAAVWHGMRTNSTPRPASTPKARFFGSDRDAGAIRMSQANAKRAGVAELTDFQCHTVSALTPPDGPPGLVIVNPPYGTRIGERKLLFSVYGALGKTLLANFKGWRIGMVTTDAALARTAGLPFAQPGPPVAHGGLKVLLFQTKPLK